MKLSKLFILNLGTVPRIIHFPDGETVILCFSMANVDGGLSDDLSEFVPNVCTNSPASGF
jgi:hypothetical protein